MEMFGSRDFLSSEHLQLPPLLYTIPGSGNTWARLLIEYATGILSGCLYDDPELFKFLPGEYTCNWTVSVVKAHPLNNAARHLMDGSFTSDYTKCNLSEPQGIKKFKRAIFLIRNPYDSIWAEFQRQNSAGSHVKGIPKDVFPWQLWQATAASLAHDYLDMWQIHYAAMMNEWPLEDTLIVKFEDLRNKQTRIKTLEKMVHFLHLDDHRPRLRHEHQNVTTTRLECAFLLAENPDIHRHISSKDKYVSKDEAYFEELACRMWQTFGNYATIHGYKVWNDLDCRGYSKLPHVIVGANGEEYDNRSRTLDFRGLPKQTIENIPDFFTL